MTLNGNVAVREMARVVANAIMSRRAFIAGQELDPRRRIYKECGYPDRDVLAEEYQTLYDREPYAARVVELMPKESWKVAPSVYEEESADVVTPFEQDWLSLPDQLRGEHNWYGGEEGNPVLQSLLHADVLSGIGRYGVLLFGVNDGRPLDEPVAPLVVSPSAAAPPRRLMYLRAYPEALAPIAEVDRDRNSPRFMQPISYNLTVTDPIAADTVGIVPSESSTRRVHWTRVLHIADGWHQAAANPVYAAQRCRPVLNPLLDIIKVRGSSAEGFWQGGFPMYSVETIPQLGPGAELDVAKLTEVFEKLFNGLQRWVGFEGAGMKQLAPTVSDPRSHIEVQEAAICIKLACPVRVFRGSERGELASSQDDDNWNGRVRNRIDFYNTPCVLVPFVNRCVCLGVVRPPMPRDGKRGRWYAWWPDLTAQSDDQKATVSGKRIAALVQYADSQGASSIIPPKSLLTDFLDCTDEEANSYLEDSLPEAPVQEGTPLAAAEPAPAETQPSPSADPIRVGPPYPGE